MPLFLCAGKYESFRLDHFILLTLLNGLIIWSFIDLKYVLKEHHLIIKAGLIKHQIPYENIDKVVQKRNYGPVFV